MRLISLFVFGLALGLSASALAQTPAPPATPATTEPPATTAPATPATVPDTATQTQTPKALPKIVDENIATSLQIRPDEEYVKPNWPNLMRAMVRAGALNLMTDDKLLDEYASITECDIYHNYFHNDFEWNKVRGKIRESISMNKDNYPERFYHEAEVQLDRYDFATKLYHFRDRSVINHVNVFVVFDGAGEPCGDGTIKAMPRVFRALLNDPISMYGLSLESKDAEALLTYMDSTGNSDHILYVDFDFSVKYMTPLRKELKDLTTGAAVYHQTGSNAAHDDFRMDVVLDRVRFYADSKRTILVYTLKP